MLKVNRCFKEHVASIFMVEENGFLLIYISVLKIERTNYRETMVDFQ
jgi:hypothetical protein